LASRPVPKIMKQGKFAPWFYLAPALILMFFFIVYPMFNTIGLSFRDSNGEGSAATLCKEEQACWGVFENYRYALTGEIDKTSISAAWKSFWISSFGNTIKWIFLMVSGTVIIGLLFAKLVDGIKHEGLAKAILFMPMAISFVGAGVIWKFVYNYGTQRVQIGILNAIITALGGEPVSFLTATGLNTIALVVVGTWMWTGFCMTILSSSLKSVPEEILEAARVDGANEWHVFTRIIIPIIMPTIIVVITTMVINVLKQFDIVYVMTGGNFHTDVIANRMYTEMYINYNTGRGTAIAVILIMAVLPFIYINIKRFMAQEEMR